MVRLMVRPGLFLAAFAMASSVHAAAQRAEGDPIDDGRGVHVFGDLLLDYHHQVEVGGYRNQSLANCSTETVFCSQGDMATFVVPRSCQDAKAAKAGDLWQVSGIRTVVLGRRDVPLTPHDIPGPRLLLGSEDRPYVVYEYLPEDGITALYADLAKRLNLVEAARGATGEKISTIKGVHKARWSLDKLAACASSGPVKTVSQAPFPPGWTALTRKDVEKGPDIAFRRDSNTGFLRATGDFDGDGKPDLAVLAQSNVERRAGVIFRLSSRKTPLIHIVSAPVPIEATTLGITRVAPGSYRTACAKGYGVQKEACAKSFASKNDGVELFQFEAGSSYLFVTDDRVDVVDVTD